eukprot:SAG31_NODE_2721_length_5189_cov_4.868566_7_plen_164_part_00
MNRAPPPPIIKSAPPPLASHTGSANVENRNGGVDSDGLSNFEWQSRRLRRSSQAQNDKSAAPVHSVDADVGISAGRFDQMIRPYDCNRPRVDRHTEIAGMELTIGDFQMLKAQRTSLQEQQDLCRSRIAQWTGTKSGLTWQHLNGARCSAHSLDFVRQYREME